MVALTTSAYSCYSSCRQYRENLADAAAAVADEGVEVQLPAGCVGGVGGAGAGGVGVVGGPGDRVGEVEEGVVAVGVQLPGDGCLGC